MSIITEYTAYLMFTSLAVMALSLLSLLILTFFVPKKLLDMYFCEPYFNAFEVTFFTGPLYSCLRTVMMMRLAGWSGSGTKRGIPVNANELSPVWFQVASRWQAYTMGTALVLFFVSGGVFYILTK